MTSSRTSSAPYCSHSALSPALKPGSGGTTPMLAGRASVMTTAISSPSCSKAVSTADRSL
jgi:hypothetical protein